MSKSKTASSACVFMLVICLIFSLGYNVKASEVDWNSLNWNNLDYGLYWYGLNNTPYKFVQGQSNPAFDPSKPTVIYIHGWQPNFTAVKHRESFYCYLTDSADAWINAGWNVGIFYWNQLSDETLVEDAEAKIWSTTANKGMRWRKGDGSYSTYNKPTVSAGDLLYNEFSKAMEGYTGNNIRIVGHSLGSQMAIRLTKLISDNVDAGNISPKLLPSRVALLDPYFSNFGKSYLNGQWTGDVCSSYVRSLIDDKNIPFELYKSSDLTQGITGDENKALEQMCAYTYLNPLFLTPIHQLEKHMTAKYTYFTSFPLNPPAELVNGEVTENSAASASTSTLRIAQMMGPTYKWNQVAGQYTTDPSDDEFEREVDTGEYTAVTAMNLEQSSLSISPGQMVKINAQIVPEDATNKMLIWECDNSAIADVTVNGVVIGKGKGQATITATSADGLIKKSCLVTVN